MDCVTDYELIACLIPCICYFKIRSPAINKSFRFIRKATMRGRQLDDIVQLALMSNNEIELGFGSIIPFSTSIYVLMRVVVCIACVDAMCVVVVMSC